jgi:hypothetical protein
VDGGELCETARTQESLVTQIAVRARNKGPGKSPLRPIAASAIASFAAVSARRSVRAIEQNGSIGMKSTVPAIVVRNASVGKRVMRRMPDLPAVRSRQLSLLPMPSDVTTPRPVTATGTALSREDAICFSFSP